MPVSGLNSLAGLVLYTPGYSSRDRADIHSEHLETCRWGPWHPELHRGSCSHSGAHLENGHTGHKHQSPSHCMWQCPPWVGIPGGRRSIHHHGQTREAPHSESCSGSRRHLLGCSFDRIGTEQGLGPSIPRRSTVGHTLCPLPRSLCGVDYA